MRIRFHLPTHIRLVDGEPPAGGSDGGGEDGQPKSFTQEQVDQIVEKRLAKERGKYKDYDELKDKATKFDEAQDAGKSELDRLKESNAALQKQIDDAAAERQHAEWVAEVAKAKEELEEHANLLHAALHPASKGAQVRNQAGTPSHQNNSKDAEELSYIRKLLGQ